MVILAINFRIIAELGCLIFVIDEFLAEFEILFVSFDMCDDALRKRMPLRRIELPRAGERAIGGKQKRTQLASPRALAGYAFSSS
jgi:hypothetical protein